MGISWGIGLLLIFGAVFLLRAKFQPAPVVLHYGQVPEFRLKDSGSQDFTRDRLKGRVWIVSFLFTRCQGQCPMMIGKMKKLAAQLPAVQMLSVTSDPDYDTPEIIQKYMKKQSGIPSWTFLTGPKSEILKLTQAFMMATPENPEIHSTRFVLIDPHGGIRGFFDSQDPEHMKVLNSSAQILLREVR